MLPMLLLVDCMIENDSCPRTINVRLASSRLLHPWIFQRMRQLDPRQ